MDWKKISVVLGIIATIATLGGKLIAQGVRQGGMEKELEITRSVAEEAKDKSSGNHEKIWDLREQITEQRVWQQQQLEYNKNLIDLLKEK